jgi:hypothetical protein
MQSGDIGPSGSAERPDPQGMHGATRPAQHDMPVSLM